jgi:thioredoxin 1
LNFCQKLAILKYQDQPQMTPVRKKEDANNLIGIKENKMAHAMEVTDANFTDEVLNSTVPVLVDFWAEWCGPCKMIAPAVVELAKEYEGRAKVVKLDVDSNYQTAGAYDVRSIPTLLFFKNGKVVDKIVGAVPKQKLKEKMEANL